MQGHRSPRAYHDVSIHSVQAGIIAGEMWTPVLVREGSAIAGGHEGVSCQDSFQAVLRPLEAACPVSSYPGKFPAHTGWHQKPSVEETEGVKGSLLKVKENGHILSRTHVAA